MWLSILQEKCWYTNQLNGLCVCVWNITLTTLNWLLVFELRECENSHSHTHTEYIDEHTCGNVCRKRELMKCWELIQSDWNRENCNWCLSWVDKMILRVFFIVSLCVSIEVYTREGRGLLVSGNFSHHLDLGARLRDAPQPHVEVFSLTITNELCAISSL
jgi:hypothetical protein